MALFIAAVAACSSSTRLAPLPEPAISAESASVVIIAPGVKHRSYWMARGPWAVNVLDVDRESCWSPVALKGAPQSSGRTRTSTLFQIWSVVARTNYGGFVAGAVNADFFSLATGAPTGAHVHLGTVWAGPVERPSFGIDSAGNVFIAPLTLTGVVWRGAESTTMRWNRPLANDITVLNSVWATRTDSASGAVEIGLRPVRDTSAAVRLQSLFTRGRRPTRAVVTFTDTGTAGVEMPRPGWLIVAGTRADSARRARLLRLAVGDTVTFSYAFEGIQPREAVGGFPMLLRDGAIAPETEAAGSVGFRNRNPRTAVGLAAGGRRMLFVTVDGRQPGYSDGMTLTELADLMRRLGATDALNLDGGGSTTFVLPDSTSKQGSRVANRPSDKEGERTVGNAIAIENTCRPTATVPLGRSR